jgi:hypothetical protein
MSVTSDDLDKTVIAVYGPDGSVRAIGKLVGYYSEPVAYILLPDGTEVCWAASLCREATAEEVSKQS